ITLCKWDGSNSLEYAGANNPIYLISNAELVEIKGDKQPIGNYFYRKNFTNHKIDLQFVDAVYLSTDGYADQFGGVKDKKYLYGRLKRYLTEIHDQPVIEQKAALAKEFNDWKGSGEQIDDVCILGICFR